MANDNDNKFPRLIVFDLDYTLWPCWCDTHVTTPIKAQADHKQIIDSYGQRIGFYTEVPEILPHISRHESGMEIAIASKTGTPRVAKQMLKLLYINGRPSTDLIQYEAWGTHSKINHFKEIQRQSGIPYEEMLFFDDEVGNRDVTKLGVTFVLLDEEGVNWRSFNEGLRKWRSEKHGIVKK